MKGKEKRFSHAIAKDGKIPDTDEVVAGWVGKSTEVGPPRRKPEWDTIKGVAGDREKGAKPQTKISNQRSSAKGANGLSMKRRKSLAKTNAPLRKRTAQSDS